MSSPEEFDASLLAELDADLLELPTKRPHHPPRDVPHLSLLTVPDLHFLLDASELFAATHHLRAHERLHNDKIEKLLLLLRHDSDDELDAQMRTRALQGRYKSQLDALDVQLDHFLLPRKRRIDDNKENAVVAGKTLPKRRKEQRKLPLLQTDLGPNRMRRRVGVLPQRVCVPRTGAQPGRPSIKFREQQNIFVVDSLTGSVNDATQFGTELNASNCEGFPLPEDVNEIVQIPTNDAASAAHKMAIIKALHGKAPRAGAGRHSGFYLKREFDEREKPRDVVTRQTKTVQWAEELEW